MTKIVEWCNINTKEKKDLKPIKILKYIGEDEIISTGTNKINYPWKYISLVNKGLFDNYDLIVCWDDTSERKFFFWGYWNDGVV